MSPARVFALSFIPLYLFLGLELGLIAALAILNRYLKNRNHHALRTE